MTPVLQAAVEAVKMGVVTAVVVPNSDVQASCLDQLFVLTEDDRYCERDDDLNVPSLHWGANRRLYVTTRRGLARLQRLRPGIELVFPEHG